MHFFLGEAMELAGRQNIMRHVKECDSQPWIDTWHESAMDEEISILKGQA